ncbi:MAG: beta-carotene 15,15'-dioxygenase, Brp/Blh family [Spirochaetes bacterium]|jgi:Brp/Blh family beta-carotene 15,15'-monooxygenase|nr:beta-carotene 15,15'-dioxygenase, Brp/Blh family [Spirochaetota bacterium]
MTFRATHVYTTVVLITVAFAVASAAGAGWLQSAQYALLAAGTIVIGIPHGATDNHVYRHVLPRGGVFSFYAGYLLIAGLYGLLWALAPTASLLIFLLLSVYHFGQSDLFYIQMRENAAAKKLAYLPWGAFNLVSPILFRYDQAAPVIEAIVGYDPIAVSAAQAAAPWVSLSLLGLNVVILGFLFLRRRLGRADLLRELAGFAVLFTLYATAPLYVSFIVYWAFWHSLNSAIEISRTWSGRTAIEQLGAFFRAAVPLSLITFAGMGLIFLIAGVYGSRDALIAMFFIIIAAVTLPHMVVMEMLYRRRVGALGSSESGGGE